MPVFEVCAAPVLARLRHVSALCLLLVSPVILVGQSSLESLFVPAAGVAEPVPEISSPGAQLRELRSRSLTLNRLALAQLPAAQSGTAFQSGDAVQAGGGAFATTEQRSILLNLFPDTALPFFVEKAQPTYDGIGTRWTGSIRESLDSPVLGDAVLTVHRGSMAGFVRLTTGEYYRLSFPAFGAGEVRQLAFRGYRSVDPDYKEVIQDAGLRAPGGPFRLPTLGDSPGMKAADANAMPIPNHSDFPLTVTILVAFAQNGSSYPESYRTTSAETLVAEANQVFSRSDAGIELRLVGTTTVNWNDLKTYSSADYDETLTALQSTSDGKMDEIHALRDQTGADLVCLMVRPTTGLGYFVVGMAYLLRNDPASFAPSAFSVVHFDYAGGPSLTFAHEIGHNLGLVHDEDNGGAGGGLHPYSKGYQQKTVPPKFFTVMAYAFGCEDCLAIPHFSNPNVSYGVIPTGIPDQVDAARTLRYVKTFAAGWRTGELPVPACTYSFTEAIGTGFDAKDHIINVTTKANCSWTAVSNVPWITVLQGASGSGNGTVLIRIAQNDTLDARVGTLLVAGKTVSVSQSQRPCVVDITPQSYSLGNAAATLDFVVTMPYPCRYAAETLDSWITFPGGNSYVGSQTVKANVAANSTGWARTGTVTIANTRRSFQQNALPMPCRYTWSQSSVSVGPGSSTFEVGFSVDPGCRWSLDRGFGSFVSIEGSSSGVGNGKLVARVLPNPTSSERTAVVQLEGQPLTVQQAPRVAVCSYILSNNRFDFPASGGTFSVTLTTEEGCTWSPKPNANWLQREAPHVYEGSATLNYRVLANTSPLSRISSIDVGTAKIIVEQAGVPPPANCSFSVTPELISFPSRESTELVKIDTQSNCPWAVDLAQSWVTVPTLTGAGPTSMNLRVSANQSLLPRSAAVRIGGKTVTVNQTAMSASMLLWPSPQVLVLQAKKNSTVVRKGAIQVAAGAAVLPIRLTAPTVAWLRETVAAASTQAPFEVSANPTGMAAGVHETTLTVTNTGGALAPARVPVLLQIRDAATVRVSPQSLSFRSRRGTSPAMQTLHVQPLAAAPQVAVSNQAADWLTTRVVQAQGGWQVEVEPRVNALPVGVYDTAITVRCESGCAAAVVPVRLAVEEPPPAADGAALPRIASGGIVNAASFVQGLSSGAWQSVFGEALSPVSRLWQETDFDADRFPLALDGVKVTVAGVPAAMNYVSPGQLNFQAPSGLPSGWVKLELQTPAGSDSAYVWVAEEAPGVFMFDAQRQIAALLPDGTPARKPPQSADPGRAARPGEVVAIYATGFGATAPEVPAGRIFTGAAPLADKDSVVVTVGGTPAQVQFAGLSAAGLNQLNVVVPPLPAGAHAVVISVGGVSVQPGLVLHVAP